jgi:hypothetical protein
MLSAVDDDAAAAACAAANGFPPLRRFLSQIFFFFDANPQNFCSKFLIHSMQYSFPVVQILITFLYQILLAFDANPQKYSLPEIIPMPCACDTRRNRKSPRQRVRRVFALGKEHTATKATANCLCRVHPPKPTAKHLPCAAARHTGK